MKNVYLTLAVVSLAALVYVFFFYNPCTEPSDYLVALTQLNCVLQMDAEDLHQEACKAKGEAPDCEITIENDEELVNGIISQTIHKCTVKYLKDKNFCTDNIKKLGN